MRYTHYPNHYSPNELELPRVHTSVLGSCLAMVYRTGKTMP